jgi:ATP-dependent metalloprotease FtsH
MNFLRKTSIKKWNQIYSFGKKLQNTSSKFENKGNKENTMEKNMWTGFILTSSLVLSFSILNKLNNKIKVETISIQELKKKKDIISINIVDDNVVLAKVNDYEYYKTNIPEWKYFEKNMNTNVPIYFEKNTPWEKYVGPLISLGIFGIILLSFRKNVHGIKSMMDVDKSIEIMNHVKTRFKDVIGQKNAKRSTEEFVDILKNREKYVKLGVNVPKGALLSGPPGTGKTLIAKAIAGESNLPFINMVGSDFNAMFVGVGSSKVNSLYNTAKEAAKIHGGCIVFIDEIDAIGQKRSSVNTFGGNSERENTLNQLLTEMDGFDSHENVITFAATNRPELLDPALLRAGRFDRKISVDLPTIKEREELFTYYFNKLTLDKSIINEMSILSSKLTPGFSGADIANVVNESGIIAVRKQKQIVQENDIKDAIDYVMMGNEKDNILTEKEKNIVAYHEAGHAYLSCILENVENPVKVSIIPREKGMLGFSQSEVSVENLYSKKKMEELISVLMGGRICEEIFCEDITNGASNDIEKATQIAKDYIKKYGFSPSNRFMNYNDENPYKREISNYLIDNADQESREFLNEIYEETKDLLKINKDKIEGIKNELLNKETIYYSDIKNILDNEVSE